MRITLQLGALVVDFLDVALGARRADDVLGLGHPLLEPLETLPAHAGRQHGNAATAEDARNRDAAAAVVAGGRPDRFLADRIETAAHQLAHQHGIGRQHLVRPDHRKAVAEQHDDRRLDAADRFRDHDVARHVGAAGAVGGIVPVDPPEIFEPRLVWRDGRKRLGDGQAGIFVGSASCEKVGSTTPSSRARAMARERCLESTISGFITSDISCLFPRLFAASLPSRRGISGHTNISKIGCRDRPSGFTLTARSPASLARRVRRPASARLPPRTNAAASAPPHRHRRWCAAAGCGLRLR